MHINYRLWYANYICRLKYLYINIDFNIANVYKVGATNLYMTFFKENKLWNCIFICFCCLSSNAMSFEFSYFNNTLNASKTIFGQFHNNIFKHISDFMQRISMSDYREIKKKNITVYSRV